MVAAPGQVIADGQTQSVGGTSASSPTFAGMISVINGARMAAGKPALGFLNPWLYKNTAMFKDVTVGSNKVSRAGSKLKYGWACLPGWDAATGELSPLLSPLRMLISVWMWLVLCAAWGVGCVQRGRAGVHTLRDHVMSCSGLFGVIRGQTGPSQPWWDRVCVSPLLSCDALSLDATSIADSL